MGGEALGGGGGRGGGGLGGGLGGGGGGDDMTVDVVQEPLGEKLRLWFAGFLMEVVPSCD